MAYRDIDKTRFLDLLQAGVDDNELRKFFVDSKAQLIQKGARVQNLPHGNVDRIRMIAFKLPSAADSVVQKWFSSNIHVTDLIPAAEVIARFEEHEDAEVVLSEDLAKKLSRSCLVHLFSLAPPQELITFLRTPIPGAPISVPEPPERARDDVRPVIDLSLAKAILALAEHSDPDPFLSNLDPALASFLAGVRASTIGMVDEFSTATEALAGIPDIRQILEEFEDRRIANQRSSSSAPKGVQLTQLQEPDPSFEFDFGADEVIGICTKDSPETAVFVHPVAIRRSSGDLNLLPPTLGKTIFYSSGDLIAFTGKNVPRQPKKGEIGIWKVAMNSNTSSSQSHWTNFHLASEKTTIYEIRKVPFDSKDHDSVREYIKSQYETDTDKAGAKNLIFLLLDHYIIGSSPGKDLSRDEGFEEGVRCWRALDGFQIEGRGYVAGPLPVAEKYECAPLTSTFRKLMAGLTDEHERLTIAQRKRLVELVSNGEARLNAERVKRLSTEVTTIIESDELAEMLVDKAMSSPEILHRIDATVQERIEAQASAKSNLRAEIAKLEKQQVELAEKIKNREKEQKALAPAIARSIRQAVEKAKSNGVETLSEVLLFQALMDAVKVPDEKASSIDRPNGMMQHAVPRMTVSPALDGETFVHSLRSLGLGAKHASAVRALCNVVAKAGLVLIVQGIGARLLAQSWCGFVGVGRGIVLEGAVGITDDHGMIDLMAQGHSAIGLLDANLSPIDVYARPVIDCTMRFLSERHEGADPVAVLMTLSDGVAALPIPNMLKRVSVSISLEDSPSYISEDDARALLDADDDSAMPDWLSALWKPAQACLVQAFKQTAIEDAAIALSLISDSSE